MVITLPLPQASTRRIPTVMRIWLPKKTYPPTFVNTESILGVPGDDPGDCCVVLWRDACDVYRSMHSLRTVPLRAIPGQTSKKKGVSHGKRNGSLHLWERRPASKLRRSVACWHLSGPAFHARRPDRPTSGKD